MSADRLQAWVYESLPKMLARGLGPLLRRTGGDDTAFLDPVTRAHNATMLARDECHWEQMIDSYGLAGRGSVLDVGCGAGAWLNALGRVNSRVVGIDLDSDGLAAAETRTGDSGNVEVLKMSAEALGFDEGSFDAVACLSTLPYIDQYTAIREMRRVLRPGGHLVLATVGFGYYAKHVTAGIRHGQPDTIRYGLDSILVAAARAVAGAGVAPGAVTYSTPGGLSRLLRRNGFEVERVVHDVDAVDPRWPARYLGRAVYFVILATRRAL
jgi:SAM-dependent methyltransferase